MLAGATVAKSISPPSLKNANVFVANSKLRCVDDNDECRMSCLLSIAPIYSRISLKDTTMKFDDFTPFLHFPSWHQHIELMIPQPREVEGLANFQGFLWILYRTQDDACRYFHQHLHPAVVANFTPWIPFGRSNEYEVRSGGSILEIEPHVTRRTGGDRNRQRCY